MAKTISINFLENSIVMENQQEAENKATRLTVDFTGAGVDTWAKWVDYKAADGTGMPVSLGLGVIVTHEIPSAVLKKGMLFIQAYAMDGEYLVKGKVFGIQINPSLNITTNTTEYDPTLLETFQQAISDIEMQVDEVYDAYLAGAFDGDSAYDVAVDNGFIGSELEWLASLNGADGAQLTNVAFVGDDMVFTKDDATTVSLVGAKLTLKGDTGATGTSIVSASFIGNDLVFVKSDATSVTIVNGKLALKGDTGATGAQGIPGNDGLDGKSAYEVAVTNGFVGTEAEWLLSLKGERGEAGEGLPSGGTLGQLLIKQSSTYADAVWADNPSAPAVHNHDDRYYTETEMNTFLSGKANTSHNHAIADVTGLQTALDGKVDDSQVLTNVPAGAVFTDTIYAHPASHPASIITQDASNRFVTDAEKAAWNGKSTYVVYTATIESTSWTGSSAPYSKAVAITGLLSTDEPIIDLVLTGTYATDVTMRENWSKIYRGVTSADSITFYADEVPTADINIQLVVVR